eukprot:226110-Pleurochrysis_carterae.AAC.1
MAHSKGAARANAYLLLPRRRSASISQRSHRLSSSVPAVERFTSTSQQARMCVFICASGSIALRHCA